MIVTKRTRRDQPASFTLIELLVVIAIIAVLVSLTSAAVMKILDRGPHVKTRSEIAELEIAHATFRTEMNGAPFIPSRIKLSPKNNYTQRNVKGTDDWFAVQTLQQIFGRSINLTASAGLVHDWSGSGSTADFVLEGPECLVFFLGGIPTPPAQPPGCLGFSKDPSDPAKAPTGRGESRYGPYYPFNAARLVRSTNVSAANFLNYQDPYAKTPYAYYSWYGTGNDYNAYPSATLATNNDCKTLSAQAGPVNAYFAGTSLADPKLEFINPKSFQIISAGRDGKFGAGGNTWKASTGYGGTGVGADDLANFSSKLLGYPTN
jgi:prepilin-type N-terminal cleavage/methylation domain-containing protein